MVTLQKGNKTIKLPENQVEFMIKQGWEKVPSPVPVTTPLPVVTPAINKPVEKTGAV